MASAPFFSTSKATLIGDVSMGLSFATKGSETFRRTRSTIAAISSSTFSPGPRQSQRKYRYEGELKKGLVIRSNNLYN
jgi:hypothetical protein